MSNRDNHITGVNEMFGARNIAVIGASDDISKIAGRPYHFLKTRGFNGNLYAVNPRRETVQGDISYPSLAAVGQPIDLAIVAVPASFVLQAVTDCVAQGVRSAVIFAGGMAEAGAKGREVEDEIRRTAKAGGLRLLGPNCMGLMNLRDNLYASFSNTIPDIPPLQEDGGLAVVSQSGALGNFMLTRAIDAGIQVEKWIATGNESDVEFAEAIEAVATDPRVRGILAYLEGARNGERLISAFKTARDNKVPVALIKVGATEEGAKAVKSHTDAIVGDDGLYDALFRRYGVQRVHTIDDLLELGRIFSSGVRASGDRLLLTSISGGVGIIMAEAAVKAGLTLPSLSDEAKASLKEKLPFMSANNPLDVTGQASQNFQLLTDAIEIGAADVKADVVINFLGRMARNETVIDGYLSTLDELMTRFPESRFLTVGMFGKDAKTQFRNRGYLAFTDPTRAVESAQTLVRLHRSFSAPRPAPIDLEKFRSPRPEATPDEQECYALLNKIGISVPKHLAVKDQNKAETALGVLKAPLVMKVLSRDIAHKSEVGGVRLGLESAKETGSAMQSMLADVSGAMPEADIRGVLLMETERDFTEVVIGAKVDPQLGTSIMVGLGGIFVEILADVSVSTAPVTASEVHEMLKELRGYPLLLGARGQPPRDINAVAEAAARLSCFAAANIDWLASIEINPFAVGVQGHGGKALDCFICMKEGK